jgi:hypothetical protein
MRNLFISVIFIFCYSFNTFSQVKAVVLDEKGTPIPFATVINSNSNRGVVTNEEGRFELEGQPYDNLVIRCIGYQEYKNTAAQLQKDSIITLKEAIYHLNEVIITHNDASDIVRKFYTRIRRNYPKQASIISGVYKEYSTIENEYYGFLQTDVDIYIKSIASYSHPIYLTKVNNFKSFHHSDREKVEIISPDQRYDDFWLYRYQSFLWNFKQYQYTNMGYVIFNETKLVKIKFQPKHIDRSEIQVTGIMFIDMNTYALIFLHCEMLPNEMDFYPYKGRFQKPVKVDLKMMFEFYNDCYYPSYIIETQTTKGIVSDWDVKPNNKDTINIDFVFNFFTRNIVYKSRKIVEDSLSLDKVFHKFRDNILDKSESYKSDFILETEAEKRLMER